MEMIIAHPNNQEQSIALKAVMQALKVSFETKTDDGTKSPYNPEFVAKILQGDEDIKAGRTTKISLDDIKGTRRVRIPEDPFFSGIGKRDFNKKRPIK